MISDTWVDMLVIETCLPALMHMSLIKEENCVNCALICEPVITTSNVSV